MRSKLLSIFIIVVLSAGIAEANLIVNGDFETLDNTPGKVGSKTKLQDLQVGQWNVYETLPGLWYGADGDAGIEVQYNTVDKQYPANHYVELDSHGHHGQADTNSSMFQRFTTFDNSVEYMLTFDYRSRGTNGEDSRIAVSLDPSAPNAGNPIFDLSTGNIQWQMFSFNLGFLDVSREYVLGFTALGPDNSLGGFIDNVSIQAVAEPATMLLFGTGLVGLAGLLRKK